MPLLCITFGDTLQVISSTKVFKLIGRFQSFSTNANHKATEASANGEWEAPPSDVLEVLQWSVLIKMKHLNGSIQRFGIYMFILSAVLWILSWIFVTCLNLAAARQVRVTRAIIWTNILQTLLFLRYFASEENFCVRFCAKT